MCAALFLCFVVSKLRVLKLLLGWNHQVCEDAAVVVIFLLLHGTQWFTESQVRFCVCSCFTCLFGVKLKVLKLLLGCDCQGSELQCYWWCCIFLLPLALKGSPRARWDFVYATVSWSSCWAGTAGVDLFLPPSEIRSSLRARWDFELATLFLHMCCQSEDLLEWYHQVIDEDRM